MASAATLAAADPGNARLAEFVWATRYRDPGSNEADVDATFRRVADALSSVESEPRLWRERFLDALRSYRILPGGRILAGAGTHRQVTLFNCFVMGPVPDSLEGIFEALKEGALTMQQGGGVGFDFSTLRPRGTPARTRGTIASGPVSFMQVWDAMCATILSTGARRGAMMATLRCDHPDIDSFIAAKRAPGALRRFNLSVLITDAFMQAVRADADWPLLFPGTGGGGALLRRVWSGTSAPVDCQVHRVVRARELWQRLCESAYESAEPGVLFIDRVNALNNLGYCEQISATNPCGEQPLPGYGACTLGSLNLCAFVLDAFTPAARLDEQALAHSARLAVRLLDNVIDLSHFPLPQQRHQALLTRRLGLGITGLADALAMLGLRYDGAPARETAAHLMRLIRDSSYQGSVALAAERGAFPALDVGRYLERPLPASLPEALRQAIRRDGIRNSHLTAIAPAATISLLAHNVSSGIEPMFGIEALRRVLDVEGNEHRFHSTDYAYALWRARRPQAAQLPESFLDAEHIAPAAQLSMQAALQPYVDGAISKTIQLPAQFMPDELPALLQSAFGLGLKGCTVYRAQARRGVIAAQTDREHEPDALPAQRCGTPDRECD